MNFMRLPPVIISTNSLSFGRCRLQPPETASIRFTTPKRPKCALCLPLRLRRGTRSIRRLCIVQFIFRRAPKFADRRIVCRKLRFVKKRPNFGWLFWAGVEAQIEMNNAIHRLTEMHCNHLRRSWLGNRCDREVIEFRISHFCLISFAHFK